MVEAEQELNPWEVPPGEAYWQALLLENASPGDRSPEVQGAPSLVEQENASPEPSRGAPAADAPRQEPWRTESTENSASWALFAQYQEQEKSIELCVTGYNRGGLLVRWEEVTGFVPASQLCQSIPHDDDQSRMEALAERVGCVLELQVIEVDPSRNRLILSERTACHVSEPDLSVLDGLNPGDVCQGRVTNLCAFGAFVDLGGIEGLVHISEISWGRVAHPADLLDSGQQVEVYVLNVDRELGRVGLSIKRLRPDPWNTVEARYQVGQTIEGTITHIVKFGVFVRLEEGLEGLIHSSELATIPAERRALLREGEGVRVSIMSIEGMRHRIGLCLAPDEPVGEGQDLYG